MRARRFAIVFGLALATQPFSTASAAYKSFGKWDVSCSNGLNCDIRFYDSDSKAGANAFVSRSVGADAPATLAFTLPGEAFDEKAKDLAIDLSIDGQSTQSFSPDRLHYDAVNGAWTLPIDVGANAMAEALKKGKAIEVTAKAGGKTVKATVPLAGMAASLLFMDDVQNRVGHTDALVAKGDKPPSPMPPVTDIRTFKDLPEAIRGNFSDENAACGGIDESSLSALGGFTRRYSEDEALYVVPCGPPGAYNVPFVMYHQSGTTIEPMQFPIMAAEGPSLMGSGYNLDYDAKTETMTSFFKGRGLGDCGSYYEWKITDGDMGRTLVLTKQTEKGDCDGQYGDGPDSWPAAWPLGTAKASTKSKG